jgi:hypothetical protein
MRSFLRTFSWAVIFAAAWIPARGLAHPGHGDAAHFIAGGPHTESGAHQFLAHPWFAAALLVTSVLVIAATASSARARARSLQLPRLRTRV